MTKSVTNFICSVTIQSQFWQCKQFQSKSKQFQLKEAEEDQGVARIRRQLSCLDLLHPSNHLGGGEEEGEEVEDEDEVQVQVSSGRYRSAIRELRKISQAMICYPMRRMRGDVTDLLLIFLLAS